MQGCDAVQAMLVNLPCSIRSLTLDRCNLGLAGIVCIIQALSGDEQLHRNNRKKVSLKLIIFFAFRK